MKAEHTTTLQKGRNFPPGPALLMPKLLLLLALLLISVNVRGQIMFENHYGGSNTDGGSCVIQTNDNGYMVVGHTESFGAGGRDVYLIRTDEYGTELWARTYGGPANDQAGCLIEIANNEYIITGITSSVGAGASDIYVVKLLSNGDTVWTRSYGWASDETGSTIIRLSDENFIVTGSTSSFGSGLEVLVIEMNNNGDTVWSKRYGKMNGNVGCKTIQTTDNRLLICGSTFNIGFNNTRNVYAIKTTPIGDTIWTKTYGGSDDDQAFSACLSSDNCYIISGSTKSFGEGGYDMFLMKLDTAGNELWFKTYGGVEDDWGGMVQPTDDNGYIITGYTESYGAGGWDVYLIKTNELGDTLWTRTFGGLGDEHGSCVKQTSDNGYIISSYSNSYSSSYDVLLIKTNSQGIVGFQKIFGSPDYIEIYPNPNNGSFSVELFKTHRNKLTLSVYDINGRLCYKHNGLFDQTSIERIELTNLPDGFYIVNIQGDSFSVNKKIIINN